MKMMSDIAAPAPGIVREVLTAPNVQVMDDTVLFTFEVTGEPLDEAADDVAEEALSIRRAGSAPRDSISGAWQQGSEAPVLETDTKLLRTKVKTTDATFKKRREVN